MESSSFREFYYNIDRAVARFVGHEAVPLGENKDSLAVRGDYDGVENRKSIYSLEVIMSIHFQVNSKQRLRLIHGAEIEFVII